MKIYVKCYLCEKEATVKYKDYPMCLGCAKYTEEFSKLAVGIFKRKELGEEI